MKIFLCFLLLIHVLFGLLQLGLCSGKIPSKYAHSMPRLVLLGPVDDKNKSSSSSRIVNLTDNSSLDEDSVARWEKLRREQIGELAEAQKISSPKKEPAPLKGIWNEKHHFKLHVAKSEKECLFMMFHGMIFIENLGILYRDKVLSLQPLHISLIWMFIVLGLLSLPAKILPSWGKQTNPLKILTKSIQSRDIENTRKLLRDLRMDYRLREELPFKFQKIWLQTLCDHNAYGEALDFGGFLLHKNPENRSLLKQFIPWLITNDERYPLHLAVFLSRYLTMWPDQGLAIKVWETTFSGEGVENVDTEVKNLATITQSVAGILSTAPR